MGYRSVVISEELMIKWPKWFVEKYDKYLWFNSPPNGVFASKYEAKVYGDPLSGLPEDIQEVIKAKCLKEDIAHYEFRIIYFHEDGKACRCLIDQYGIVYEKADFYDTDTPWG